MSALVLPIIEALLPGTPPQARLGRGWGRGVRSPRRAYAVVALEEEGVGRHVQGVLDRGDVLQLRYRHLRG